MNTVGLIAEYNPFHNGHKYHIEKAKEITGADYALVVMSGNFVQRGAPALIDKYTRTKLALEMGADFVFELPISFACASAEQFAFGAISVLERIGFVDSLCFGCEAGELPLLEAIAQVLSKETKNYQSLLNRYLKEGHSFPAARAFALQEDSRLKAFSEEELRRHLLSPNNILGIEYLKALKRLNSPITPYALKRIGSGYLDPELSSKEAFSSATAIRYALEKQLPLSALQNTMPMEVLSILEPLYKKSFPLFEDDFSIPLYYKLLTSSIDELQSFGDVSSDLAFRIKKQLSAYQSFSTFAMELKTKQYTLTRIRRCLLHCLLELPTAKNTLSYVRLLGFRKNASHLLKTIPASTKAPILTKAAHGNTKLPKEGKKEFQKEVLCNDFYNQAVFFKYGYKIPSDYTHPLVIL